MQIRNDDNNKQADLSGIGYLYLQLYHFYVFITAGKRNFFFPKSKNMSEPNFINEWQVKLNKKLNLNCQRYLSTLTVDH